jgi:hypothetical protein
MHIFKNCGLNLTADQRKKLAKKAAAARWAKKPPANKKGS